MRETLADIPDRSIAIAGFALAFFALIITIGVTLTGSNNSIVESSETSEPQVFKGERGSQGNIGETGPSGSIGPQGLQGSTGPIGPKGDTVGVAGPQGSQGIQGIQGSIGERGIQGLRGLRGLEGEVGFLYPTPLSLSAPTFNYPIIAGQENGVLLLSVSALGQELGGGGIRPRVDLTNRQAFRVQFTHGESTDIIKVGMQYLSSELAWETLIPAFGEEVEPNTTQTSPFVAIPQFVERDFTIRIIVYGDHNTDVRFSYLAIDAR